MKSLAFLTAVLVFFTSFTAAWTKEDHEIFQLNDALKADQGPNSTFYTFIGVPPSASQDDINRAYRRLSARLHPDKARQSFIANYGKPPPGQKPTGKPIVHKKPTQREIAAAHKAAEDRYARLSAVANVLRGENRERYDYFLKHGFPAWRGTGYYYERFRPGIGSVLIGLVVVMGGVAHYAALYVSWRRQRSFVSAYIRNARRMAWGDESGIAGIPGVDATSAAATGYDTPPASEGEAVAWNRRQKRLQERESRKAAKNPRKSAAAKKEGSSTPVETEAPATGPQGAKKRVTAQNGKVLIVDSVGNVFLEEETQDGQTHEFLLDENEISQPTIRDTVLFKLPGLMYRSTVGRLLGQNVEEPVYADVPEDEEDAALDGAAAPNANAEVRRRKAKARGQRG
ncbi:DnaJ domain protein [Trichodelitschia bisporula]|uniref:DnaJ domain protein n=1 Tax=Trichodelitschia bisporula TaxID=703511 RepID=A0A6G1IBR8_9PEZI|nr:DnaJ domain protein [Trichodelitschia bisporula]